MPGMNGTMKPELTSWLRSRIDDSVTVELLPGDVSGRSFWRVSNPDGSFVLMDSGKVPVWPWIDVHGLLEANGFRVPEILEIDTRRGWVLQEDLGDVKLNDLDEDRYPGFLERAVNTVLEMQRKLTPEACTDSIAGRRSFTPAFLMAELEGTLETVFYRLLGVPMEELLVLQEEMRRLCNALDDTRVFVHRDFHGSNLMVTGDELVMLDWQDARFGSPSYDLVSLLRDSYRDAGDVWEDLARKFVMARGDMNMFQVAMAGTQRNLKAIGTFGIQYRKTGNRRFLEYIPRSFRYLEGYAGLCPHLESLVQRIYRLLDEYHGEIDLRDFRDTDYPEVREG